jgi:hypothetical protein
MKVYPRYSPGDMLQNLDSPIPVVFIVVDSYWTNGGYTYEMFAPDVPHKTYYKREYNLTANYKVIG